jgi:hypothetical protein
MANPTPPARPAPARPTIQTAEAPTPIRVDESTIVSADDFFEEYTAAPLKPVAVPGIQVKGQPVYVCRLTAGGLDKFFDEVKSDSVPDDEYRGAVLAFAIVRENGSRVFEPRHRSRLSDMPGDKASEIIAKFYEVNGLSRGK